LSDFSLAKIEFDKKFESESHLPISLVPIDGKNKKNIPIKSKSGSILEEYYKWQFVWAITKSGLYDKEYIGVEVFFPKGNKQSTHLKIDACIFDDKDWISHYNLWRNNTDYDEVDWLRKHLIGVVEFKRDVDEDTKEIFSTQLKPALKESELDFCMGVFYNEERLFMFQRKNKLYLRYDESKNEKKDSSTLNELSLEHPDSYLIIPSLKQLLDKINKGTKIDRTSRSVTDLDIITGINSTQLKDTISNILRDMDKVSLVNELGYKILIQLIAMKIFDEKHNDPLLYYIIPAEKNWSKLNEQDIQSFVNRMKELQQLSTPVYKNILKQNTIDWKDAGHIKIICSIVENFQDFSFTKSYSDLYQLVFYRFANEFAKISNGQYITPLTLIQFLVDLVNPKDGESILDPTLGIADFLSTSFVKSNYLISDKDLFGVDNAENMVMMAQLNMLLNGDGDATLKYQPDMGSILYKFNEEGVLVELDPKMHKNGNWDNWADHTKLKKFDIILTNPPFGEDRKFEPKTYKEKEIAELYELWNLGRNGNSIDLGVLFLENAVRSLGTNGRLGMVVSNSIASIDRWAEVRKWLSGKMRIVATFDLPPTAFADAVVRTTLIVAYKPPSTILKKLQTEDYEFFSKRINKLGYEVKSTKRIKNYHPIYKLNEKFEVAIDGDGKEILDEDFTSTVNEFKEWAKTQEKTLQKLFL
jgi:type I restriction enzyme M protein